MAVNLQQYIRSFCDFGFVSVDHNYENGPSTFGFDLSFLSHSVCSFSKLVPSLERSCFFPWQNCVAEISRIIENINYSCIGSEYKNKKKEVMLHYFQIMLGHSIIYIVH